MYRPPHIEAAPSEITALLDEWTQGDPAALDKLMPAVFDDVRVLARRYMARESVGHTLQTTALINEVYLRLKGRRTVQWRNRAHFFGTLAELMRHVLVSHARQRLRQKRGGGEPKVAFDETFHPGAARPPEIVALDEALESLAEVDPRKSQLVELRFFIGLTETEIADILDISKRSVSREWQKAKLFLRRQMRED